MTFNFSSDNGEITSDELSAAQGVYHLNVEKGHFSPSDDVSIHLSHHHGGAISAAYTNAETGKLMGSRSIKTK